MKKIIYLALMFVLLISQSFAERPIPRSYTTDATSDVTASAVITDDAVVCGDGGARGVKDCVAGASFAGYFQIGVNQFRGVNSDSGSMRNETVSSTNPTLLPNRNNLGDGIGSAGADQPNTVAGGVEAQRWTEASREIEANTSVCVIATDNVTTTAAHALAVDDVVVLTDGTGDVCAPLVSGTNYYVQSITDANNFKVAATRGGGVIDITEDASGNAFTSSELEITVNIYGVLTITGNRSTTPTLAFGDLDAFAGDDNTQIVTQCTDPGDGTEDCDMTFSQQVAGNMTPFITADADGSLTITPNTIITGSATLNDAVNLGDADADTITVNGNLILNTQTVTSSEVLTTDDCGKTIFLNHATTGIQITLPTVSGTAGCSYRIVHILATSDDHTIISGNSQENVINYTSVLAANAAGLTAVDRDIISFVDTADSINDQCYLISNGSKWFTTCTGALDGAFSSGQT